MYSDEDCITALRQIYKKSSEPITRSVYDDLRDPDHPAASTIRNHFNNRWTDATRAAGVPTPGPGRHGRRSLKQPRAVINFALYVDKKERGKCYVCGEQDPRALHFDHDKPPEKQFTISQVFDHNIPVGKFIKEMEKCSLLCSNCHMKRHNNWPPSSQQYY